ncbi:MAG: vWA domain-containing protein, partial [Candidatus Thorarchaeota archaeon]
LEIRYSLNRQLGGSQLLTYTNGTDNFFVYLLAPSIVEVSEIESRQYVFVLDKSGSMSGTKIVQAKAAFNSMIELLQPNDLFNVVAFDSNVLTLWVEPHSASVASIEEAQNWVSSINAGGSTNFHGAMMTSLDMMIPGDDVKAILMLSDGQPTAGEITSSSGILSAVEEANDLGVSISTVAFGSDSDENLMANLAAQNDGFFVFIQPDEEAAARLVEFYSEFATPIADSYSIEFEGILDMSTMKPLDNSPFFNGSEILVCGRYESSMNVSTSIDYPGGTETYTNSATTPSTENEHIEKLWAQHRITYLLRVVQLEGETPSLRDEIINLGMQYGIIVEGYTALLITTDYIPGETETYFDDSVRYATTTTWTTTTTTTTAGGPPAFSATLPIAGFAVGTLFIIGLISIVIWRRRT